MMGPREQLRISQPLHILIPEPILRQAYPRITPLAILEPGKPRSLSRERIGKPQADRVRPRHLQDLLDQRVGDLGLFAFLGGCAVEHPPGHDERAAG